MEEKEFNKLLVKTPELAPKMKACREAGCITLEEASALSGLDVETLQKVENGDYCQGDDMVAYQQFFLNHVPDALDVFDECEEGISTKFDYMDPETGDEVKGADLNIKSTDDEEAAGFHVSIPELGPKFKEWREASNITLEQASQLSGIDVDMMQKLESGKNCTAEAINAYHEFFMKHIPNAPVLYANFMEEILTKHGYTYDEEGNEYKDGVPTTEF